MKSSEMICLHCDGKEFVIKSTEFPLEIRDETITVESEAFVCNQCGEPLMNSEQMDNLRKLSADEYRKQHGLLQSHEIIDIIKRLRMPYSILSDILNITPNELKKYETFYIQSKEVDDLLREINPLSKNKQ